MYKYLRINEKIGFILGLLLSDGYLYKQDRYATFYQALSLRKRSLEPTVIDLIEVTKLIMEDIGGKTLFSIGKKYIRNPTTKAIEEVYVYRLNIILPRIITNTINEIYYQIAKIHNQSTIT